MDNKPESGSGGLNLASMDAITTMAEQLRGDLDSSQLARTALAEMNRLLMADFAVVYLRGGDNVLYPLAIYRNSEEFKEITSAHHELGQCLCGLAAGGEIIYVDNIHDDARCTQTECKEAGIHSFAALPLRHGDEIIGVLSLGFVDERDLSASRVLVETMADLLAMGLHNTLLFEKIESYAAEQQEHLAMLAMNAEINAILTTSSDDISATLQLCCEVLVKTLQAFFVRIWEAEDDSEYLRLVVSAGEYTRLDGSHSRKKKENANKISKIFQTRTAYVNNEITNDPLIIDQDWVRREGMRAFVGMPLFVGDNPIGVMAVFSKKPFAELQIKGVRTVSDTISLWLEQKITYNNLIKQTRLFEAIFNEVPNAFVFANPERKIQICNQGFTNMFGYSPSEVVGRKTELLYADKADYISQGKIHFNSDASEQFEPYEINYRRRDGTEFPAETIATVVRLKDNNELIGYLGLMRDVTLRKEAEKHQRHMQKMEALGTLSGGIAHDFNNLLNAIGGFTDLTLMDMEEGSAQYANLSEVKKACRRAADLVKQILAFSRGTEDELRPMAVQHLVKEVVKLLSGTLPATIQVKQHIEPCGMILADASQIHQVLMNLSTNAYNAMRQTGGVLEIDLRQVEITSVALNTPAPGNFVQIIVSDTGCGMSDKVRERIFEPYFTTKNQDEGTGLGLATVHGIITAHGGKITVESAEGVGSTFKVYLPIIDTGEVEMEDDKVSPEFPEIKARVLFVDDVEFNVDLGKQILERTGCTVRGITASLEALDIFRRQPDDFDLVITDQTMPEMTGFDMAREMLQIRPNLPIIMVTGHSELVDKETALRTGIGAFLDKPLHMGTLLETVVKMLDSHGDQTINKNGGSQVAGNNDGEIVDIEAAARAHLKEKYRLSDEQVAPMLAEVQKSLPELMARAIDNHSRQDWPALDDTAHTIKGQLLTLGLDALAEEARSIELAAKAGKDSDYDEHLERLNVGLGDWGAQSG
jgi:PAS domain S-box-containing protein